MKEKGFWKFVGAWTFLCFASFTLLIVCAKRVDAQQPDPDTPFLPYLGVQLEAWEAPQEELFEHDLELYNTVCPFYLKLKAPLEEFSAECKDVLFEEDFIGLPVGCRFTFKLEGYDRGRIVQMLCPSLLLLYKEEKMLGA